ncbi:MAG: N-acetylmuramoyl-L-alanine amidase [Pseudomonadales bacterium]
MMRFELRLKTASILLGAGLFLLSPLLQAANVDSVRLWRAPDHTRLVLDLSGPVEHKIITLANPHRVVIDIPATSLLAGFGDLRLANTTITQIRSGVRNKRDLRLVLDMKQQVKPRSFMLKASGKNNDRLVVDLYDADSGEATFQVAPAASIKRDIIIAIDAGHGGEDPGALGPGKLQEKKVVLAIARKVAADLKKKPGYKPVLIRNGDYYVGLVQRRDLARKHQADLFISVHADAFSSPKAKGSSVYALSQRGATSASARFLAQKENSADLVGGVSLSDKDDVLAGVLFDLSMTASLDASLMVGREILEEMDQISKLHKNHVEQAGFAVLKSPDIPSILVETGFISNPTEARLLNTASYQQKMAKSIVDGLVDYFESHPPDGSLVAWQQQSNTRSRSYVISRGDTLSGIAQRYRVSVDAIRRHNGMASNTIRIGQKITIPAS